MAFQTLNTATASTGLDIAYNVTTGGVGLCSSQTTGTLDIGTFGSRSGQITIGSDGATGPLRLDAGSGGIDMVAISGGEIKIGALGHTGEIHLGNSTTPGAGNIEVYSTGNFNVDVDNIRVLNTDQCTSLTNGSAEFKGGISITKNLFLGENLIIGEDIRSDSPTRGLIMFNATTTGDIEMGTGLTSGDIALGNVSQTGKVHIKSTNATTSISTGALVVDGGIGVGKKITCNSHITSFGNLVHDGSIRGVVATQSSEVFDNRTTGDINVGSGLTTGDISLGNSSQTGQVKILGTVEPIGATDGAFTCAGGATFEKRVIVGNGIQYGSTVNQVTQLTNNTTTVVLSHTSGVIHTFGNNISAHNNVSFTFFNTHFTSNSIVHLDVVAYTGTGAPYPFLKSRVAGAAVVQISNASNTQINAGMTICFSIH